MQQIATDIEVRMEKDGKMVGRKPRKRIKKATAKRARTRSHSRVDDKTTGSRFRQATLEQNVYATAFPFPLVPPGLLLLLSHTCT